MAKQFNMSLYFLFTWLFSMFLCASFLNHIPMDTLKDQLHTLLVLSTYGLMYQAPAIIFYWGLRHWRATAVVSAIIFSVVGHGFIFLDSRLYDLYAFHINGFVWNLFTTPGGIASLGADQTNPLTFLGYVSVLGAVHACALFFSMKSPRIHISVGTVILCFVLATLAERGIYGYSRAQLHGNVLERGDAMPLYQPMKMNSFLKWVGVEVKPASKIKLEQAKTLLQYPKHPIELSKVVTPLNIIILVSESMRWDLLTPEIMPNMSAFAQKAWNFTSHFSGGNGTRQGLFSLFYGIHGNYWDIFLRHKKGPVLFEVLNEYQYQYFVYTSATFTYPELDQTIFSEIPSEKLIENSEGPAWQRDEANTTALIRDIQNRDPLTPFFGFLFYEATHACYSFPEDKVVRKDYLKNLDYADLSRKELALKIDSMKARYENSAHGIDLQLQRIVESLETSGDLDTTLIIITGDHGEEFMERGRWGHNSAFTDWQVRVPMVLWMPGTSSRIIPQRTSHMDVGPFILNRLGVKNPIKDYSLGIDLSTPEGSRNIVVSSWSDIGLINDHGKMVIPFKSTTQHQNLATDGQDHPVNARDLAEKMKSIIFESLADARYYDKQEL